VGGGDRWGSEGVVAVVVVVVVVVVVGATTGVWVALGWGGGGEEVVACRADGSWTLLWGVSKGVGWGLFLLWRGRVCFGGGGGQGSAGGGGGDGLAHGAGGFGAPHYATTRGQEIA